MAVDFPTLGQSQPPQKIPTILIGKGQTNPSKSKVESHSVKTQKIDKSSKAHPVVLEITSKVSTLQVDNSKVASRTASEGDGITKRELDDLWREKLEWAKEKKELSSQLKWMTEERDQLDQLLAEESRVKLTWRIEELERDIDSLNGLLMEQERVSSLLNSSWCVAEPIDHLR